MYNTFFYIIIPYLCVAVFITGTVYAITRGRLAISAPATGFFEKRKLSWGITAWHYAIIIILTGHLLGFLFPKTVMNILSGYKAMFAAEALAFGLGLAAFLGTIILLYRRITEKTVSKNSNFADYFILIILLIQVILGLSTAANYRWGINWYASHMSGYLKSLVTFTPDVSYAAGMPGIVTAHIVTGFLILAVLPFTRLMHLIFVPVGYFFRKPQQIIFHK